MDAKRIRTTELGSLAVKVCQEGNRKASSNAGAGLDQLQGRMTCRGGSSFLRRQVGSWPRQEALAELVGEGIEYQRSTNPRFHSMFPFATRTLVRIATLIALVSVHLAVPAVAQEQDPVPSEDPVPVEDPADSLIEGYTPGEINDLVSQLGAKEFAVRERASDELMQIGTAIIPRMKEVKATADDPEIRLRASEIVRQLTSGDLAAQIESFLAGEDVEFEGWQTIRGLFGDTQGARDVFVELMTQHPKLVSSLEGETRDRALAAEAVISVVQNAMTVERRFPNRADVFALLLASVDPKVPDNATLESQVIMVLNQNPVRQIRKDWQLNRPFELLLAIWMSRSTMANRQEILEIGMRMDFRASLELALRTVRESDDTDVIITALQTIARFGQQRNAIALRDLIHDNRAVRFVGFSEDPDLTRQLGDAVMVTITILHKLPLKDFGFPRVEVHPKVGFTLDNVGFSSPKDREKARDIISELFPKTEPPELR